MAMQMSLPSISCVSLSLSLSLSRALFSHRPANWLGLGFVLHACSWFEFGACLRSGGSKSHALTQIGGIFHYECQRGFDTETMEILSLSLGILTGCTDMTRFFALRSSAWSCQRTEKLRSEMDLFPTNKRPKPIQSETVKKTRTERSLQ
jgi:hypothetical protein